MTWFPWDVAIGVCPRCRTVHGYGTCIHDDWDARFVKAAIDRVVQADHQRQLDDDREAFLADRGEGD